jgi:hypothetical protein
MPRPDPSPLTTAQSKEALVDDASSAQRQPELIAPLLDPCDGADRELARQIQSSDFLRPVMSSMRRTLKRLA